MPCSLADRKSLGVAAPHSTHNWTTTCGLPEENTTDYLTASRAVSQLTEIGQGSAPFFFDADPTPPLGQRRDHEVTRRERHHGDRRNH